MPKSDQLSLFGGAREYDHWFAWTAIIPEGFDAVVRIAIPQVGGSTKTVEQKYSSGRHLIQFHARPAKDESSVALQLRYGEKERQTWTVPFAFGDPPVTHPPIVNIISPGESVRLVSRSLKSSPHALTLDVQLAMQPAKTPKAETP